MEDFVKRLKASKEQYDQQEKARGRDEGIEWAKTGADFETLLKISKLRVSDYWDDNASRADCLAQWLDWEAGFEQPNSLFASFRDEGNYPSDDYADAFYDGVMEIWEIVEMS